MRNTIEAIEERMYINRAPHCWQIQSILVRDHLFDHFTSCNVGVASVPTPHKESILVHLILNVKSLNKASTYNTWKEGSTTHTRKSNTFYVWHTLDILVEVVQAPLSICNIANDIRIGSQLRQNNEFSKLWISKINCN